MRYSLELKDGTWSENLSRLDIVKLIHSGKASKQSVACKSSNNRIVPVKKLIPELDKLLAFDYVDFLEEAINEEIENYSVEVIQSRKDTFANTNSDRLFPAFCYIGVWLYLFYTLVDNHHIATPDVFIPLLIAAIFQTLPLIFLTFSGIPVKSGYYHCTGILLIFAVFTNLAAFASAGVALAGLRDAWNWHR